MLNDEESTLPSFNPKIRIAKVREYDYHQIEQNIQQLLEISKTYDDLEIVRKMKQIVPEFKSRNSVYEKLDQ